MAPTSTVTEDTASSILVGLIVGSIVLWSGNSVWPSGLLDWFIVLALGATYILLAHGVVQRLRKVALFSRAPWYARLALIVLILGAFLLLTLWVIQYVLEMRVVA